MTPKERAMRLLDDLPLGAAQRKAYIEGVNSLSDTELTEICDDIEGALAAIPDVLADLEAYLKTAEAKQCAAETTEGD
jgi:hypothetical protein